MQAPNSAWALRWLAFALGLVGCIRSKGEETNVVEPASAVASNEAVPTDSRAIDASEPSTTGLTTIAAPTLHPATPEDADPTTETTNANTFQTPEPPPNEPTPLDNSGVWLANGTLVAHGTGTEWEYFAVERPPAYNGCVGRRWSIGGASDQDVWLMGPIAYHFVDGAFSVDDTAPWGDMSDDESCRLIPTTLAGTSPIDLWAAARTAPTTLPLIHFDGEAWHPMDEPAGPISAVWANALDDVWVMASALYHFDGSAWSVDTTHLGALAGSPPNRVWVGMRWHYDGENWTEHHVDGLNDALASSAAVRSAGSDLAWAWQAKSGDAHVSLYRFDGERWEETEKPPNLSPSVHWAPDNETSWIDFYPTKRGLWTLGLSTVLTEAEPAELAAFPIVAHVLHNDGDGWIDVTPNGLKDAGSTIWPTTPSIWVAPQGVETDGYADAGPD